jgi:SPP1 family predicted phage head-tail adaptor
VRAGELRQRVEIQRRTDTQDSVGQPIPVWSTVATVWARVEPLSGREFFTGQQLAAETDTRITIRFFSGLDARTMRAVHEGVNYDIRDVIDEEKLGVTHTLMCKSGLVDA